MLEALKIIFPLVDFSMVDHTINPRNEDALYPLGATYDYRNLIDTRDF